MIKIKILLLCLILASSALAFTPEGGIINQEISIPYYDNQPDFLSKMSSLSTADASWAGFIQRHGHWAGNVNDLTGLIHRAWGGAIYVGVPSSEAAARDLALSFLRSESALLGISTQNLAPLMIRHRGHHWFVDFKQVYEGIDVHGSRVSVRISDAGNIVLFECDYMPDIHIQSSPLLGGESAKMAAMSGLISQNVISSTEPSLIIFPVPAEGGFIYRLAYKLELSASDPARWLTVVDANTGEILYRKDLIYYYTVDGHIDGLIYPTTPFDSLVSRPFEFEDLQIGGLGPLLTDSNGYFTGVVGDSLPRSISATLTGECVNVVNSQGAEASYSGTIVPGETLYVVWNSPGARADERNSYYHTNVAHDFIKAIDPAFNDLDFPLTCNVNLAQTCNAYWDGSSINFFMRGGGCSNTGEIADVIYHEYGHGITDFQYRPSSPSGAQHEGWSDYTAATITNQPLIGRGFYSSNPDQYLRTVDNTNHYPEDWIGEPHNDGLIIAGALWDLRESLAPRIGYCDSLFHFARYGLSSNYEDYLIDVLIYDDDDDNLFNGTPNWDTIMTAFDLHGIVPLDRMTISHQPLDDTFDSSNPYPVLIEIDFTLTPPSEDSIFVKYRTRSDDNFIAIPLIPTGSPGQYSGNIPAQAPGTLIEYYISVTDRTGRIIYSPISAPTPTYFFFIGQLTTQFSDSLEHSSGWTVGAPGDDATTGIWVRVDPVGTWADSIPNYPYQPEDDHTPDPATLCYITGQQPAGDPNNGANDVDGGRTTLLSPVYNLSSYDNPVIEYYRWFTTSKNIDDTFYVDISSDGGSTWVSLETQIITENFWKRSRFLLSQLMPQTSQVKLRFIACDEGSGSIVEGGVDDISLYSIDAVGIGDDPSDKIPNSFILKENYPNPFNGKTEIAFELPRSSDVELLIFDISGRLVFRNWMPGLTAGRHSMVWDAKSSAGGELSSGIYLYKIKANEFTATRKMLLLK